MIEFKLPPITNISVEEASTDMFEEFYNKDAITYENHFQNVNFSRDLDNSITNITSFLTDNLFSKVKFKNNTKVYYTFGRILNEFYDLEGDNRYIPNAIIVFIPLEYLQDQSDNQLGSLRSYTGCRWFRDIVDNNEYTEFMKGRHKYTKNIQWLVDYFNGIQQK